MIKKLFTFLQKITLYQSRVTRSEGEPQKHLLQRKELYGVQGRTSRGLSVRGKSNLMPPSEASHLVGATPPEKPAPERSTTDTSLKSPCFNAFSPVAQQNGLYSKIKTMQDYSCMVLVTTACHDRKQLVLDGICLKMMPKCRSFLRSLLP